MGCRGLPGTRRSANGDAHGRTGRCGHVRTRAIEPLFCFVDMDLAADMSVSKQYRREDWHEVFPVCDMVDLESKLIDKLHKRVVADLDTGLD